jgi:Na+-driven multidrug efflux pump
MTTKTAHANGALDHERVRLIAWVAVNVTLLALFAMAAARCWATEPLTILVLPVPLALLLVALVVVSDRWTPAPRD